MPVISDSARMRFFAKVERTTECHLWRASRDKQHGYGQFVWNQKVHKAHRIAWMIASDVPIPEGLSVLHRCDNPPCVNPDHLFLGTSLDNMRDMVAKGRQSRGERHRRLCPLPPVSSGERWKAAHPANTLPRGERHGMAKLSESDVREIRLQYAEGSRTQVELAKAFGVNQTMIGFIVRRVSWVHVA